MKSPPGQNRDRGSRRPGQEARTRGRSPPINATQKVTRTTGLSPGENQEINPAGNPSIGFLSRQCSGMILISQRGHHLYFVSIWKLRMDTVQFSRQDREDETTNRKISSLKPQLAEF